jgi:hypothetical protein
MRSGMARLRILGLAVFLWVLPGDTAAQYMYLDANSDSAHDSTDALFGIGIPTTVGVYLVTDRTAMGDSAVCNSGLEPLTPMSYFINLRAVGGTATFSNFVNERPTWSTSFGEINPGNSQYVNGFGGVVATALPAGGPYLLCTVEITSQSGVPGIEIASQITISPDMTSFGSPCEGQDLDNTYKLGVDWFDALGLPQGIVANSPPLLSAPSEVTGPEDVQVSITANASDIDGVSSIALTASGFPSFLELSTTAPASTVSALLAGTPGGTDSGTWTITWVATEQSTALADSVVTTLHIADSNQPSSVIVPATVTASTSSPVELDVRFVDPNNDRIEQLSAGPLPPGADFDVSPDGTVGLLTWVPPSGASGEYPITFTARSRGGLAEAQTILSVTTSSEPQVARVTPTVRRLLSNDARSAYLVTSRGGVPGAELFAVGTLAPEALRSRGCIVGSRVDSIFSLWCPLDSLPSLFRAPGLSRITASGVCRPTLDSTLISIHADGIRSAYPPPYAGHQGESVLIGIVDSGIDAAKEDFWSQVGVSTSSRIYRMWDQIIGPYFEHPSPAPWNYGSEYTTQQINSVGGATVQKDSTGHGTMVAGIAAGNGRGGTTCRDEGTFIGVAPESKLCIVKRAASEISVLDAIDYVFSKADSLDCPAVVNLSLTSHVGGHDGDSYFDQFVSEKAGPGRIIVAAAGNDGRDYNGIHASVSPHTVNATQTMAFDVIPYTPAAPSFLQISGWMKRLPDGLPVDSVAISVTTPRGTLVGPFPMYESGGGATEDGHVYICIGGACTETGSTSSHQFQIELSELPGTPPREGRWEVHVRTLRSGSGNPIDFYIVQGSFSAGWIQGESGVRVVGSPATADSVIAVGAYTSKDCWKTSPTTICCESYALTLGQIADFSSRGPRRDDAVKPDLCAPGAMIASVRSAHRVFTKPERIVYGANYVVDAGTSLASPVVAGAAALLLGRPDSSWATAGPTRVRQRLVASAQADQFTGSIPNAAFGHGKLDVADALSPLQRIQVFHPSRDQIVGPNPDSVVFKVAGSWADSVVFYLSADSCLSYGHRIGKAVNVEPGVVHTLAMFSSETLVSPRASVRGFAFAGGSVVAATSEGFFMFTSPTGVESVGGAPLAFKLGPNFPNPFNPSTTIQFQLPNAGRATVSIYSASGRLIRTLADGFYPIGNYHVAWDGTDSRGARQASGIYFVRAVAQGNSSARRICLLR